MLHEGGWRSSLAIVFNVNPPVGSSTREEFDEKVMSSRPAKFTQSEVERLFKAAAKAGVNVRVEFRHEGTIIAITIA